MRYKRNYGELSHQGFNKLSNISQRAHARGREAGGWLLKNGDVSNKVNWGSADKCTLPDKPVNGLKDFHVHPNASMGVWQVHSLDDIEQGRNVVIGWKRIYQNNGASLPANYKSMPEKELYNYIEQYMVDSEPNNLYSFPYFLFYFGN